MLLSGVMLTGFTSLNAQKVRISTPDSVNAVVIDYKVLPPANAVNVPQDFNVGKKEYYYVIWDHYIICCDPGTAYQPDNSQVAQILEMHTEHVVPVDTQLRCIQEL